MDKVKKRTPKIRFRGFNDEWEQRKLGDIASQSFGGGTPSKNNAQFWKGNFPWIQSSNLSESTISDVHPNKFITENAIFDSAAKKIPKNSIAIVSRVGVGKVALIPFNYSTSQDFLSLSGLQINTLFAAYDIHIIMQKTASQIQGTSIKGVTKKDILNKSINFPTIKKEQTDISNLLKLLDTLITLQQRKSDQLNTFKKALLQKMFADDKHSKPELRFKGFTGEWGKCELGDISDIVGGGTPSTKIKDYWNGSINWYSPAEIGEQTYISKSEKQITKLGLKNSSAHMLPIGTVLFTSRASIGNTAILTKEACTNQGFQSIVPKFNILDSYFIFSMTDQLKRYGERTGAGSTFVEVSGKQMSKMPIKIPKIIEQKKISKLLKNLNNIIEFQQNKLDKLNSLKKFLLQNMFI